ncbi:MAG TPA: hypothetical protein VGF69_25000 [Thermoanaerobaculia bacterium]|jgi:tetrahydromethanopterin S-methyltransferase subunit D
MSQRLSLINYDVLRELCDHCRKERFHFVPIGAAPATGNCKSCGAATTELAEMTDTSVFRLITHPNGEMVIVPLIKSA